MKTNNQPQRTIYALYLKVNLKKQGGYVVMDFKYGILITRRKVTDILVKKLLLKPWVTWKQTIK